LPFSAPHKWRIRWTNGALLTVGMEHERASITIMNLKSFWERHRARRWAGTAALPSIRAPKAFQPPTREEVVVFMDDANKKMQFPKRYSLLILGVAVLMAALAPGAQLDSTGEPGASPEALKSPPINEVPEQALPRSFESFSSAVEKVAPGVVRIVTSLSPAAAADLADSIQDSAQRALVARELRGRSHQPLESGLGSGVIVTEDGYIVTNCHLLAGVNLIEVTLLDGREFKARVIGLDPRSDIAVIKISAHHLPTVPLAENPKVRVGDVVLAIGHPFGVGQTVTHGIVSATDRGGMGIEDYESFIQTDAPMNPGNSGGALVDVTGHLIGINTAILSSSGANVGIAFAIPADLARRVVTDLVKHGHVVRGFLGVETQDLTAGLAREFKLSAVKGVLVGGVLADGPAGKAGLQVGDVITRFDGEDVQGARQLKLSVADAKPGQRVAVEIMRAGSSKPLLITIGQASDNDLLAGPVRTARAPEPNALKGVLIGELNSELRQQLGIPPEVRGAVVLDLHAYSIAAQAGLRPGDVIQSINQQEISDSGDLSRLTQNPKDKRFLLRVWSNTGNHFVLVED
jgi:Do/DeqQ family serine protease